MKPRPPSIAPEAWFVSLCAREPDAVFAHDLLASAQQVRDWPAVADLAVRHRVATYVLRSSARADVPLPDAAREQLSGESLTAHAQVMLLESELKRVLGRFVANHIPVVVLKGPALARTLYAEPSLRPFSDLDLTVHPADDERAAVALTSSGYTELLHDADNSRPARTGQVPECGTYHRQFAGPGDRVLIELHREPLQLGLEPVCEAERWDRAVPIPGLPGALMLGLEDQLMQLSVHAHKHGFNRLIWFKDLDLLLRQHTGRVNWTLVAEVARREGIQASVWWALQLTHAVLATPLPSAVAQLAPRRILQLLYAAMWPVARVANLRGFVRRRAVQVYLAESWRGTLPSLVMMGRRRDRVRVLVEAFRQRRRTIRTKTQPRLSSEQRRLNKFGTRI